jgi:hypothetical protein
MWRRLYLPCRETSSLSWEINPDNKHNTNASHRFTKNFSCVVNILTSFEAAMAQVPTPPLSREVSVEPVKVSKYVATDKVQELDNLLERYLQLIDNYQALQKKLGKNLSSVCFL